LKFQCDALEAEVRRLQAERIGYQAEIHETEQILGRLLGYPAEPGGSVVVGPDTITTLARYATQKVERLRTERDLLKNACRRNKHKWKKGWGRTLNTIWKGWGNKVSKQEGEIERLQAELTLAHKDTDWLAAIVAKLDHLADGTPIVDEMPCWVPDGRLAYIEPFRSTPVALIKGEREEDDEVFDVTTCFATQEAAKAAGGCR